MKKGRAGRQNKLIKEKRHDAYQEAGKWPEPTVCPECRALFSNGRWSWGDLPVKAHAATCPACRRIADNFPAGHIELKGPFLQAHYDEILNLTRNIEQQEKGERPLERIMAIINEKDQTLVTTTGVHVARRIGEALARSYSGDLSFQYPDGDKSIRVYWQRT